MLFTIALPPGGLNEYRIHGAWVFAEVEGGGITYLLYVTYLNPAHDRKTEQRTGTNSKRNHVTGVSFEFVVSSLLIPVRKYQA